MKIFKPIIVLFKFLYNILDKFIVTPISRLVYKINGFIKDNSVKIEKILNRPNMLIYISLFCAVGIFLLVNTKVITFKENEAEVITGQSVDVIYNEEAYIVEGVPDSVDITLIGSSSAIYLATQLGNHNVSLDLSDYTAGTYKVKLKYTNSVSSITYKIDPSTVTVKISDKVSDTRTLSYDLMNVNKLDQKLSISNVELDTSEVVIKSSKEILDKVASVKALIDASQITLTDSGDFTLENVEIVAYDSEGNKLDNVEVVPAKISAKVTVDSYNAVKSVKIITNGDMQDGKAIASISSSVTEVKVYGDKETVDAISYIEANVDVSGLGTDKNVSISLTKPTGIRYMSETKTNISISVGTETQKTISGVQVHAINLGSGLSASAASTSDSTVDIILKGVESVLTDDFDTSKINVYVDLSGYKAGTYTVPVYASIDDERITATSTKTEINVKIVQSS